MEIKADKKKELFNLRRSIKNKNLIINIIEFVLFVVGLILFCINFSRMKGNSTENFEQKKSSYVGDEIKPYIMFRPGKNFWRKLVGNLIQKFTDDYNQHSSIENIWTKTRIALVKKSGKCQITRPGMEFMEEICTPSYDANNVKTTDDTPVSHSFFNTITKNRELEPYTTYTRSPIISEYANRGFYMDFKIFNDVYPDCDGQLLSTYLFGLSENDPKNLEIINIISTNTAVVVMTINVYQPSSNLLTIYRASLHSNIYDTMIPQMDVFKIDFDIASNNVQTVNSIIIIIISVILFIIIGVQIVFNVKKDKEIQKKKESNLKEKLKKKNQAINTKDINLSGNTSIHTRRCKRALNIVTLQNMTQFWVCFTFIVTSIKRILARNKLVSFLNSQIDTTSNYYEMVGYAIDIEDIIIVDGITFLFANLTLVGYLTEFFDSIKSKVHTVIISVSRSFLLTLSLLIITLLMVMSFDYFMLGNFILYLFKDMYNAAFALNFGLSGFSMSNAPLAEGIIETAESMGHTSFIIGVGFYLIIINMIIKPHFLAEMKKSFIEVTDLKKEMQNKKEMNRAFKQRRKDLKSYNYLAFEKEAVPDDKSKM